MDAVQIAQLWAGTAEPIFRSASLARTLEFWTALGFSTGVWEDDHGYAWVYPGANQADAFHIDYSLSEDLDPFLSCSMAYVTVPDVDAVFREVVAADVAFAALNEEGLFQFSLFELRHMWKRGESLARYTRPIDQSWGKRELAVFDPDNNLIRIGSAL